MINVTGHLDIDQHAHVWECTQMYVALNITMGFFSISWQWDGAGKCMYVLYDFVFTPSVMAKMKWNEKKIEKKTYKNT